LVGGGHRCGNKYNLDEIQQLSFLTRIRGATPGQPIDFRLYNRNDDLVLSYQATVPQSNCLFRVYFAASYLRSKEVTPHSWVEWTTNGRMFDSYPVHLNK
jgi:hypothetical protein